MATILVCVGEIEYPVLHRRLSKSGHEVVQLEDYTRASSSDIAIVNLEKQLDLSSVFERAIKEFALKIPVVGYNFDGNGKPPSFCDEVLESPLNFRLLQRALADRLLAVVGKVLVAEDDIPSQHLIEELLIRLGFTCDIAADGTQALKMAKEYAYRILLLDCHMPELSGTEVASSLRQEGSSVPIVALTADPNAQWKKAGMNKLVLKPVHREELMKAILECLDEEKNQDHLLSDNPTSLLF